MCYSPELVLPFKAVATTFKFLNYVVLGGNPKGSSSIGNLLHERRLFTIASAGQVDVGNQLYGDGSCHGRTTQFSGVSRSASEDSVTTSTKGITALSV